VLQDQLNLPGAASDTNSNTEQPRMVTAYEFPTSASMEHHSKLFSGQGDQELSLQ